MIRFIAAAWKRLEAFSVAQWDVGQDVETGLSSIYTWFDTGMKDQSLTRCGRDILQSNSLIHFAQNSPDRDFVGFAAVSHMHQESMYRAWIN